MWAHQRLKLSFDADRNCIAGLKDVKKASLILKFLESLQSFYQAQSSMIYQLNSMSYEKPRTASIFAEVSSSPWPAIFLMSTFYI